MDSYRKYNLGKLTRFVEGNRKILIASAIGLFVFSLIYTGKIYDIPYIGDKLLAGSLEKQSNSPGTTELNRLRLKAISDAIESGDAEYTYEVPALLGPGGR